MQQKFLYHGINTLKWNTAKFLSLPPSPRVPAGVGLPGKLDQKPGQECAGIFSRQFPGLLTSGLCEGGAPHFTFVPESGDGDPAPVRCRRPLAHLLTCSDSLISQVGRRSPSLVTLDKQPEAGSLA